MSRPHPLPEPLRWVRREPPLAPAAVAACGDVALRLAERLLALEDAALAALTGVAGARVLLLLAPAAQLPWTEGVEYLGVDPAAPALLLPCTRAPALSVPLLERALLRRPEAQSAGAQAPLAVLGAGMLVSAYAARPLHRARLHAWWAAGAEALP